MATTAAVHEAAGGADIPLVAVAVGPGGMGHVCASVQECPSNDRPAPTLAQVKAALAGFGLLSLSHVPMLASFGLTVGPGAILALLFSAILAPTAGQTARQTAVQKAGRNGEAT